MDAAALRWIGLALVPAGGLVLLVSALTDRDGALARWWSSYVGWLDGEARFVRLGVPGTRIAIAQLLGSLLVILGALVLEDAFVAALVPLIALGPYLVLKRRREERVARIEAQIDGWLLVIANGLRAAPSLGEAIRASVPLIDAPLAEELDIALKEMRLGTPVDRAVLDLGLRVRSRTVQSALAALLIGRQTGGELSTILEETAASIREMTRLEGVLRAKTAEGRSQAYVLGAIPFFIIVAIQYIDPHWLDPLAETTTGMLVSAVSAGLWLAAILIARRVLAVDL